MYYNNLFNLILIHTALFTVCIYALVSQHSVMGSLAAAAVEQKVLYAQYPASTTPSLLCLL